MRFALVELLALLLILNLFPRHYNYKHFVFFLAATWLGCLYVAVMSLLCMSRGLNSWAALSSSDRTSVVSIFILGVSLVITLGILLCWHLYLCCTAQTTVEFYYNAHKKPNPFDLGSWRRNVGAALGEPSWKWLLPLGGPDRPGDGIHLVLKDHSLFDLV